MAEVEKLKYISTFFLMDGNSPNKISGFDTALDQRAETW